MKNTFKVLGTIALLAVLVFSFASCGEDSNGGGNNTGGGGGGGQDSSLNGTWVARNDRTGEELFVKFNNGNWEQSYNGGILGNGTYSTNGSSITIITTHVRYEDGRLYTRDELKAMGLTDSELESWFYTETATYSITGNTLTFTVDGEETKFTRR